MKIALTGGIACGKSLVSRFLNELGVETIDADEIVHELLPDPAERKRIAAEVFADPEKRRALEAKLHPIVKARINAFLAREVLAKPVDAVVSTASKSKGISFSDAIETIASTKERCFANASVENTTVQPPTSNLQPSSSTVQPPTSNLQPASFNLQPRLAIIPLLFEAHWDAEYDIICCVTSSRATQVERMMSTRGYSREEAEARLSAQLPVEEKAAKSHYVIANDGSVEELKGKVAQFVLWLKEKEGSRRIVESVESSNRRA